jgi:hypothetical protein
MGRFGFKELSEDNWLKPEVFMDVFSTFTDAGTVEPITGEMWVQRMLTPKLLDTVPDDVRALFEVVRGVLVYGYFFYPLYTLGAEQLFRVGEAAISHKYNEAGGPKPKSTFEKKIDWLASQNLITQSDLPAWNALRALRNLASHPMQQTIIMPRDAMITAMRVADQINSLFK